MEITQLTPNLAVGAQIRAEDLRTLADNGFTDIVCNRPDEEHPEDPPSPIMEEIATRLGMTFHYLPITPNALFDRQARRLVELTATPDAKVFAYCRSGARSTNAWAYAQAMLANSHSQPA